MVHIKMQLMCLMIVAYIGFLYLWERHRYHSSKISPYFAAILVSGALSIVFDAVSAKRCYRDALPLDACFDIIRQGSGSDFDPVIVQTFLELRPQVERLYAEGKEGAYVPHS